MFHKISSTISQTKSPKYESCIVEKVKENPQLNVPRLAEMKNRRKLKSKGLMVELLRERCKKCQYKEFRECLRLAGYSDW